MTVTASNHTVSEARSWSRSRTRRADLGVSSASHAVLTIWTIIVVVPFLWTVMSSFKTTKEILGSPFSLPARLSLDSFGKTGTTQDNRDALFVGYAGDLVVGVWIGRDDNTPLNGVHGGSVPAQIWHDFMVQALNIAPAPRPVRPTPSPNPEGPVQPQDVQDLGEIPLGDGQSSLQIQDNGATLTTNINGVPVDLRIDKNGLRVQPTGKLPTPSPAPLPTGDPAIRPDRARPRSTGPQPAR